MDSEQIRLTYVNVERNLEDLKGVEKMLCKYPPEIVALGDIDEIRIKNDLMGDHPNWKEKGMNKILGRFLYRCFSRRIELASKSSSLSHELVHAVCDNLDDLGIDEDLCAEMFMEEDDGPYLGEAWNDSAVSPDYRNKYSRKNGEEYTAVTMDLRGFTDFLQKAKGSERLRNHIVMITGCLWDWNREETPYPIEFLSEEEYVKRFGWVGDYEGYLFYPLLSRNESGAVQMDLQYWKDFVDLKGEIPETYWEDRR